MLLSMTFVASFNSNWFDYSAAHDARWSSVGKVSIPTGSITVSTLKEKIKIRQQFQFQLVRLQSPSCHWRVRCLRSFNSNWFDYSDDAERRRLEEQEVSIPTGSITVTLGALSTLCTLVSIPTGSITVPTPSEPIQLNFKFQFQLVRLQLRHCRRAVSFLRSFNSNWFDYSEITNDTSKSRDQVSIPTGSITVIDLLEALRASAKFQFQLVRLQ
jgi:hypothetical protein